MIAIYTDLMYGFSENINDLISLDELDNQIEILMIDYNLLIELDINEARQQYKIVVITNEYDHEEALSVYEQNIENYIVVKSGNDIDRIYHMLKNTSTKLTDIEVDRINKKVIINGEEFKLRSKEIAIYVYLREHRGEVCLRQSILVDVLNYHADTDSRLIDVYIKHLRTKLGMEGKKIKTVRGKGYLYE